MLTKIIKTSYFEEQWSSLYFRDACLAFLINFSSGWKS